MPFPVEVAGGGGGGVDVVAAMVVVDVVVVAVAAAAGDEAVLPSCWLLVVECATLFGMAPTDGCDAMTSFVPGSNEALPEAAPLTTKLSPQTQTQSVRHTYSSFCGSVVDCWSSEYGLPCRLTNQHSMQGTTPFCTTFSKIRILG